MNLGHFPFCQVCRGGVCLFYVWISQHSEEIVYPIMLYNYRERTKYSPNSRSVMFNPLWSHRLQHARPPCPSPTPGVQWDSGPSSQWCHPAISSSVVPFSSCPQSLQASEYLPMSQLFAWGVQSAGVSALASFLPKNTQDLLVANRTTLWPSKPTSGHTHRGNQNWKRHVYPNVHRSTVYNSQDMEAT